SLWIVYQNVHHMSHQMTMLLERYQSTHDVVIVTEPWYGTIRAMGPDTKLRRKAPHDPKGNHLYGTQSHPNWTLLETEHDARIAVYVNKRMVHATATIDSKIKTRDVALLRLRPDRTSDTINILGLYNDTQCTALNFLVDHINYLPTIHICGGDYNLHGCDWDTVYPTTSAHHNLMLVDLLHGALGHRLLSPPDVVTHLPDNKRLRGTVIDLVWLDVERDATMQVIANDRGFSDHAIIDVELQTTPWSSLGDPSVSRDSNAETDMLKSLETDLPHILPSHEYSSGIHNEHTVPTNAADVEASATRLFDLFITTWKSFATPKHFCGKSASWWN
ncbi:hypothetical protein LXA43DRAFT_839120, partial [Ganoderma leucocontextum]